MLTRDAARHPERPGRRIPKARRKPEPDAAAERPPKAADPVAIGLCPRCSRHLIPLGNLPTVFDLRTQLLTSKAKTADPQYLGTSGNRALSLLERRF